MDIIYSRSRIKMPKFKIFGMLNQNNNNNKNSYKFTKKIKLTIIILISILVSYNIVKYIEPIIEAECIVKAKSIATTISNQQASLIMKNYKYEDLCSEIKDENGNIKMIKSNIIPVNEIVSNIAIKIQKELDKLEDEEIYIRLGTFTKSKLLAGRGPKVNFKISSIGNVETELKSEFTSCGINQTLHKIYLYIDCNVIIITPFSDVNQKITNQILIAEAVIIGNVPNSFYNIEGMKQDNLIDIIE